MALGIKTDSTGFKSNVAASDLANQLRADRREQHQKNLWMIRQQTVALDPLLPVAQEADKDTPTILRAVWRCLRCKWEWSGYRKAAYHRAEDRWDRKPQCCPKCGDPNWWRGRIRKQRADKGKPRPKQKKPKVKASRASR